FTPARMRRWMVQPPGWTMTVCECDVRVCGALNLAWKTDTDALMTLKGVFTEAEPHERAVHTEVMEVGPGQVVGPLVEKHEFAEKGGATAMRITQTYATKEARDWALTSGMDVGMEAGYQQLDALLARGE